MKVNYSILVLAIVLIAISAVGQSYPHERIADHDDRPLGGSRYTSLISRCLYGPSQCVAVNGNLTYSGAGSALLVHDVSNPSAPTLLGSVYTAGFLSGVEYQNEVVFAADGPAGIVTIDVSIPANPTILGGLDLGGWVEELDVSGNYAYLAAGYGGLKIINISNPANPVVVSELFFPYYCRDIMVQANYVYICGGTSASYDCWLSIVDVSIPSSPSIVYTYSSTEYLGPYTGIYADGRRLYITQYGYQEGPVSFLDIWDISQPTVPSLILHYPLEFTFVRDIKVFHSAQHTYGYVAAEELFGLNGFEFSEIQPPIPLFEYFLPPPPFTIISWMTKLCIANDYAYAYLCGDWLWLASLHDPADPQFVGYYNTGAYASTVNGPHDYYSPVDDICGIAYTWNGLQLVDVSNPSYPSAIAHAPDDEDQKKYATDIHLSWNYDYAYMTSPFESAGEDSFLVCDYTTPPNLEIVGRTKTITDPHYLFNSGNYVYLHSNDSLKIYNVVNPIQPEKLGLVYLGAGYPKDIFVAGNYCYITKEIQGFMIVNISNPDNPYLTGICTAVNPHDVFVKKRYAYTAVQDPDISVYGGLAIINVSDPTNPYLQSDLDLEAAYGSYVYGNYCYISDISGLKIVDISNINNPILVDWFYTPLTAMDVHCALGNIYLIDEACGLYILRFDPDRLLTTDIEYTPGINNSRNLIAQDSTFHFVFTKNNSIFYMNTTNNGVWDAAQLLGNGLFPSLVKDANDFHCVWINRTPTINPFDSTYLWNYYSTGNCTWELSYRTIDSSFTPDTTSYILFSCQQNSPDAIFCMPPVIAAKDDSIFVFYSKVIYNATPNSWHWVLLYGSFQKEQPSTIQWCVLDSLTVANIITPPYPIGFGIMSAPTVISDNAGNLHLAYGFNSQIYYRMKTATGWQGKVTIADKGKNFQPTINTLGNEIVLVWNSKQVDNTGSQIVSKRKRMDGAWSDAARIDDGNRISLFPFITGNTVVWSERYAPTNYQLFQSQLIADEWTSPEPVGTANSDAVFAQALQNNDTLYCLTVQKDSRFRWLTMNRLVLNNAPKGGVQNRKEQTAQHGLQLQAILHGTGVVFSCTIPRQCSPVLKIYNITGALLKTITPGEFPVGAHDFSWNCIDNAGRIIPSGIYFVMLEASSKNATQKFVLIR